MFHPKQCLAAALIFLLASASVASAARMKVVALPMLDLLRAEDRELVLKIKESFSNPEHGIPLDLITDKRLHIAMVDLNGDGVQEFLVTLSSTYNCGNMAWCSASLYQRVDDEPVFIGDVDVTEGKWIWVEDTWSNGWRVLSDGRYLSCWVPESNPRTVSDTDMFNMPYTDGQAGYFWGVEVGETCPEQHPHLD